MLGETGLIRGEDCGPRPTKMCNAPGNLPEYIYQALGNPGVVRVLVVQPADTLEAPLRCSFELYDRSAELLGENYRSHAHYSAVSYTWAEAASPHRYLLIAPPLEPGPETRHQGPQQQQPPLSFLRIAANVDALLRRLRRLLGHGPVRLWVDAVCLNQRDEAEKARQIPLMGAIYQAARRVHVWLGGERAEDARRAFALLRRVDLAGGWDDVLRAGEDRACLAALFGRAWFARRWVVQEAVLAHEAVLHCGAHSIGLSWVVSALRKIRDGAEGGGLRQGHDAGEGEGEGGTGLEALGYGPRMLLSSVAMYQQAPMRLSLLKLLWDLHRSECSDERDRIAAVYGLAAVATRPPVLRYAEGFRRMCWDTAAFFVNRDALSAHELLLHLTDFGTFAEVNGTKDSLPSWVPDWSRTRRRLARSMFGKQQDVFRRPPGRTSYLRKDEWRPARAGEHRDPSALKKLRLAWLEYCRGFKHPTRMTASERVLRIEAHPKAFASFGGVVEKVYAFPTCWRGLASSLCEIGEFGSNTYNILHTASTLLDTISRNIEGKPVTHDKSAIRDALGEARYGTGGCEELSHAARRGLQKLIVVLSHFSLIRSRRNWHPSLSEVALAPRGVAVGDLLVPLVVRERDDDDEDGMSFSGERGLSVLLCLRPTAAVQDLEVTMPMADFDLGLPFRRVVRWQGLAVHDKRNGDLWSGSGKQGAQRVFQAFCKSLDEEPPGPYIFDVM